MHKVDRVFIFTLPCWSVDTQFFPSAIIRGTTCGLLLTLMYHFCSVSWFSSLVYLPAIIRWEQFEWDLIHVKRTVITYFLEGGGGKGGKGLMDFVCVTMKFIWSHPKVLQCYCDFPLVAVGRQSVSYTPLFRLCWRRLIPPPFPLKTIRTTTPTNPIPCVGK